MQQENPVKLFCILISFLLVAECNFFWRLSPVYIRNKCPENVSNEPDQVSKYNHQLFINIFKERSFYSTRAKSGYFVTRILKTSITVINFSVNKDQCSFMINSDIFYAYPIRKTFWIWFKKSVPLWVYSFLCHIFIIR